MGEIRAQGRIDQPQSASHRRRGASAATPQDPQDQPRTASQARAQPCDRPDPPGASAPIEGSDPWATASPSSTPPASRSPAKRTPEVVSPTDRRLRGSLHRSASRVRSRRPSQRTRQGRPSTSEARTRTAGRIQEGRREEGRQEEGRQEEGVGQEAPCRATPKSKSQTAPTKTGDKKTYPIAIKGPKKGWPTVEGIAVGQHFGVHKGDDGQFSLTHLPSGRSLAASGTKKRLIEIGGDPRDAHRQGRRRALPQAGLRLPFTKCRSSRRGPAHDLWANQLSYADFRQK